MLARAQRRQDGQRERHRRHHRRPDAHDAAARVRHFQLHGELLRVAGGAEDTVVAVPGLFLADGGDGLVHITDGAQRAAAGIIQQVPAPQSKQQQDARDRAERRAALRHGEKRIGDDGAERQKQHTVLIETEPEQRNDAGQAHIIAAHGLQEQKPQHGGGKNRGMVTERAGDERRGEHEQQYRPEAQQRAHQQPQPRAGRRRVECIRGLRRGKGVLRLLLRAFFPGLFFLEALELAAALFRLPLFPALGAGKLSGLLGVRGRTLRIRLAAVGPDGGTLRLGRFFFLDRGEADGVAAGGRLSRLLLPFRLRGGDRETDGLVGDRLRGRGRVTLRPAAELVHDLLERVGRLLLRRVGCSRGLRRLVQLFLVLRTPGLFHRLLQNEMWITSSKGSPRRGRFPLSGGECPEGTKVVGALSAKQTERLSQIRLNLSVTAYAVPPSPHRGRHCVRTTQDSSVTLSAVLPHRGGWRRRWRR